MSLNCMADNHSAIYSYNSVGFVKVRALSNMEWTRAEQPQQPAAGAEGVVRAAPAAMLWGDDCPYLRLHNTPPVWSRCIESLRAFTGLHCFALPSADGSGPRAYALVREGADDAAAILDLAGEGEPAIAAVLGALQQTYVALTVGNEPEDSGSFPVLQSRGFTTVNHRLQLARSLAAPASDPQPASVEALVAAVKTVPSLPDAARL